MKPKREEIPFALKTAGLGDNRLDVWETLEQLQRLRQISTGALELLQQSNRWLPAGLGFFAVRAAAFCADSLPSTSIHYKSPQHKKLHSTQITWTLPVFSIRRTFPFHFSHITPLTLCLSQAYFASILESGTTVVNLCIFCTHFTALQK